MIIYFYKGNPEYYKQKRSYKRPNQDQDIEEKQCFCMYDNFSDIWWSKIGLYNTRTVPTPNYHYWKTCISIYEN